MELKFYFTNSDIDKFLKRHGYIYKTSFKGNSDIVVKKLFRNGVEVKEKPSEVFRNLLHEKLLKL